MQPTCRRIERDPLDERELNWTAYVAIDQMAFFASFNGFLVHLVYQGRGRWGHGEMGKAFDGMTDLRTAKRTLLSRCFRRRPSEAMEPEQRLPLERMLKEQQLGQPGLARQVFTQELIKIDEDEHGPILALARFNPPLRLTVPVAETALATT